MTILRTFRTALGGNRSDIKSIRQETDTPATAIDVDTLKNLKAGDTGRDLVLALKPDDRVEELSGLLERVSLITVDFPAYTDGRGYSQCYLLRERLGFTGDVRAVGDILLDQLDFYERCGFSSYVVTDAPTIARLEKAGHTGLSQTYQPSANTGLTIIEKRIGRSLSSTDDSVLTVTVPKAPYDKPQEIQFSHF